MGKNIVLMCMMITWVSIYAMELERIFTCDYEPLTYNTVHDIYAQQHRLYPIEADCDVTSFSLKDMRKNFSEMSDDCKSVALKKMSTQLLLLSCVATYLPPDLVKHICLLMMDGEIAADLTQKQRDTLEKEIGMAADELYTTSIRKAFDRYYPIKVWLADSKAPIGPLYVMPPDKRDIILGIKSCWYSSVPVISYDEKKFVDRLDRDLKHTYLQGKEVAVTSKSYTKKELCVGATLVLAGPCSFGLCMAGGAAVGACCGKASCVLHKPFLLTIGTGSGFFSAFSCIFYACVGLADVTYLKRTTI